MDVSGQDTQVLRLEPWPSERLHMLCAEPAFQPSRPLSTDVNREELTCTMVLVFANRSMFLFCFVLFKTRSHYPPQAHLKLVVVGVILLPQPLTCRDSRSELPHLTDRCFLNRIPRFSLFCHRAVFLGEAGWEHGEGEGVLRHHTYVYVIDD